MAIINQRTGYFGYTLDGTNGANPIDDNGRVKRCIFAITYPLQPNDIEFTVTNGDYDWAAQMGDGSLINLSNPVVLFQNRDNTILQFTMEQAYPSNSPCLLVYRSDTASFNITQRNNPRPFVINSVSGHFAFTVEGYDGDVLDQGNVNRLIATLPFPQQNAHVNFTITNDPTHWGARMGDGSIIPLRDPEVLYTNADNAVVLFKMDDPYPSNSPCVLVYRSQYASYNIQVDGAEDQFIPVQDINNLPSTIRAGSMINLTVAEFFPINATQQGTVWEVVSGPGTITNSRLRATGSGTIQIRATVIDGLGSGSNFIKLFTIEALANEVDVYADPQAEVDVIFGEITERIFIEGHSDSGVLYYQWYQNLVNSNTSGAMAIEGATDPEYRLPNNLPVGTYYYFCEVSSPGATSVRSRVSRVKVDYALEGVSIYPITATLELTSERQLHFRPIPADRGTPRVTWHTSDSNIIQVNETSGMIKAIAVGKATITVVNVDTGDIEGSLEITVPEFVSVTDIIGIVTNVVDNTEYTLTPTVVPANAHNKDILWSVVPANGPNDAAADINNGKFSAFGIGQARIRAIIEHGLSPVQDYIKEFVINIGPHYTPVSDITVTRRSE